MTTANSPAEPATVHSGSPDYSQNNSSTQPIAASKSRRLLWWVAILIALSVHIVSARWHILYGAQNADEGFYAVTTRAVSQGEMPYRDFGFPQTPLVLYANSLPLHFLASVCSPSAA